MINQLSPNGDGLADTIATTATTTEAGSLAVRVANASDTTVRTFTVPSAVGANGVTWDGKSNAGTVVPDGEYTITIAPRDAAGNGGPGKSRTVRVVTLLGFVANASKVFFPQDLDRFAPTTTLSFKLTRAATVTWTLRNAAGAIVLTHLAGASLPAGTHSWIFNGRNAAGAMLPIGSYTSYVEATDGTFIYAQTAKVEMNAFSIIASTGAPKRGSKLTITSISAEPISGSARLYVTQPGLSTYILTMTRVDSRTFRVTFTVKSGGSAGTLKVKVWAKDYDGRSQATTRSLGLH